MGALRTTASGEGIALAVGFAERSGTQFYNSCVLINQDGEIVLTYRKTHLFSSYEQGVFTAGSSLPVAELWPGVRVGILICFDIEFPEPARELRLQGAQLLIVPTALGSGPVSQHTPLRVINTRALENHLLVLYSNFPQTPPRGMQGELEVTFCGRSAIVAPNGVDLARAGAEESLLVAPLATQPFQADLERNPYPTVRRPELYPTISKL